MTHETNLILTVDDDPSILAFLQIHLSTEGYTTIQAANGKEALNILEQDSGEIKAILSDVEMPEMDGYEFCQKVRENDKLKSLPFIFISSHIDLEEKLKGYSVGADDYIAKPLVDSNELIIKTKNFIENKLQHESLTKQISDSFSTTMQAMTYSSHLGQILLFLQDCSHHTNFEDVAKRLFETTDNLGANVVVQFRTPYGRESYRKNGAVSPLEENIIELSLHKERFIDFNTRTIISYENFSLLIKNMPASNPEAYGTMKDVLGNLCNAIETITEVVLAKIINIKKDTAMTNVTSVLDDIEQTITNIQDQNTDVIEDMMSDIDEVMISLGLTDSQEEKIRNITSKCLTRSRKVLKQADTLKTAFHSAHNTLESEIK